MGIKLDIGCGSIPRPGYIGIDSENHGQPIVRDVTRGLPYSDNTVSEINMDHVLEHFKPGEDLLFLFSEMWRVCHHNAIIKIRVPHSDSKESCDPCHLSFWNERSFVFVNRRDFPLRAVPACYNNIDFNIAGMERHGIELHTTLIAHKPTTHANTITARTAIIIVHYKFSDLTTRLINSIKRFTNTPYRIVLVDNTGEFKGKEIHNVEIISPECNLGWVGGINYGIQYLFDNPNEEDFYIFANNDVTVGNEGWLPLLLGHFDNDTGAVGATSNYVMGRQNICFNHPGIWEEEQNFLIGFFMCVRADVVKAAGLLEDIYYIETNDDNIIGKPSGADDLDYSIRIRDLGYKLKIARDVFIYHSGSKSLKNVLTDKGYRELCEEATKALECKWGFEKVAALHESPVRVMVGVPCRSDYVHRIFTFTYAMMHKPFYFEQVDVPKSHVALARSEIVKIAMKQNMTHVLFLDDDHRVPPDLFIRLYNMNVPVAGALAFQRNPHYLPCIFKWIMHEGRIMTVPMENFVYTGVKKVDAIGFAGILCNIDIFKTIPEPWFEFKDLGEDLDFCRRCFDYNIPIHCDTNLIMPHIGGSLEINEDTFYQQQKMLLSKG